ncbi:sigma 54-interacting transcriptional regulator [Paraburkholderia sp. GAS334]|uniref:sigma-54 dependent transcriptional regulator n=1 Tax=Paraburkholderia sp. GAS334 TaxID=3035131 RepID=UPI003D24E4F2
MDGKTGRSLVYISHRPEHQLCKLLEGHDWEVVTLETAHAVRRHLLKNALTVGIFDFASGFTAREIATFRPCFNSKDIGWVGMLAGHQIDNDGLRTVIRNYFSRFLTVPCVLDRVVEAVGHEHGMVALHDAPAASAALDEIVGECPAMKDLFRSISKVANSEAPVLISGESGTGKELTAAAIHRRSIRRHGPFVAINCGALPHNLEQSGLFGYERGAFTGADERRIGRIEAAHGGTLFLDEVGDLPLESQTILLRFLEEKKIQRLGSNEFIDVDVRIISATNVSLERAVDEGRFRSDLYHRLCVLRIVEPPLRDRGTDIELLAHYILDRYRTEGFRQIRGFSDGAIKAMYMHSWPGNVRELSNRIRRAIVLAEGRVLSTADLELDFYMLPKDSTLMQVREAAERDAIEMALMRHCDRPNLAARELGISRATLYRLIAYYGLRDRPGSNDTSAVDLPSAAGRVGGRSPAVGPPARDETEFAGPVLRRSSGR